MDSRSKKRRSFGYWATVVLVAGAVWLSFTQSNRADAPATKPRVPAELSTWELLLFESPGRGSVWPVGVNSDGTFGKSHAKRPDPRTRMTPLGVDAADDLTRKALFMAARTMM